MSDDSGEGDNETDDQTIDVENLPDDVGTKVELGADESDEDSESEEEE
jgi:hypothetical protein